MEEGQDLAARVAQLEHELKIATDAVNEARAEAKRERDRALIAQKQRDDESVLYTPTIARLNTLLDNAREETSELQRKVGALQRDLDRASTAGRRTNDALQGERDEVQRLRSENRRMSDELIELRQVTERIRTRFATIVMREAVRAMLVRRDPDVSAASIAALAYGQADAMIERAKEVERG
jgi:chromosome segregation ATPase